MRSLKPALLALAATALAAAGAAAQTIHVERKINPSEGCIGFGYSLRPDFSTGFPGSFLAVTTVAPGGPGSRAGLLRGDSVAAINGEDVRTIMPGPLWRQAPGTRFQLRIRRGGADREVELVSGRHDLTAVVADDERPPCVPVEPRPDAPARDSAPPLPARPGRRP